MSEDLARLSSVELARRIRERTLSPVELTRHCIARIERHDPAIGSVVTLDAERALEAAGAAERAAGTDGAPFLGVPTLVKDLHLTAGLRTTFGTASMAEFVPPVDEEAVARLRRAGFVILGKSNVPEFGTSPVTESRLLGPCRNPWDPARTAGGSSGGAAAAVAAGFVPVAHGSDGAGSARIPASNCGLVGVKPSRGRVSNAPLLGDRIAGLGTHGIIARHVIDAAAMLDCMRGYAVGDPTWAAEPDRPYAHAAASDPPRLRLGVVEDFAMAPFDPAVRSVVEDAAGLLADLGHDVGPATLPIDDRLRGDFEVLWAAGVASQPLDPDTYEPFNAEMARVGREQSAAHLLQTVNSVHVQSRAIIAACLDFDVVVAPTISRLPVRIGAFGALGMRDRLDAMAAYVGLAPVPNLTGQPALSVPLGWTEEGEATLPLGVTLLGRPADESTLFSLAGQLERASDWTIARPAEEPWSAGAP